MFIRREAGSRKALSRSRRRRLKIATGFLLALLCAVACGPNGGSPTGNVESKPEGSRNEGVADGQGAKAQEYLITLERMGPARLGMTVAELKRTFPAGTFSITTLPDTPSAVAVRQGDEAMFYFGTASGGANIPGDEEIISFLMTNNPRYFTEAGIKPGSGLADAIKVYGAAQFYYSPDAEYAKFSASPASRMGFLIAGPDGERSAGIYQMKPENLEEGYYRSDRFHPGSTVSYISISNEPVASSPEGSPVAEVFRPVLSQLKNETGVPVLLPVELPRALARRKIYIDSQATPEGYSISLTSKPDCGANACTIGYFEAKRGGKPSFKQTVSLEQGIKGYYKPLTCGGSCSPPAVEWLLSGVLYSIELDLAGEGKLSEDQEREEMIRIANSSIKAGPR